MTCNKYPVRLEPGTLRAHSQYLKPEGHKVQFINVLLPCLCRVLLQERCRLGPTCLLCVFGSLWFSIHVHWADTHTHTHTDFHTCSHPPCCLVAHYCWTLGTCSDNTVSPHCHARHKHTNTQTHTHTVSLTKGSLCLFGVCSYTGDAPFLGPAALFEAWLQVYSWTVRLSHSGLVVCVGQMLVSVLWLSSFHSSSHTLRPDVFRCRIIIAII